MKKGEWKNTEIWKTKGKMIYTNTGENPGYQSVEIAWKLT